MAKNFRIYVNEKLELNKTITLDEDQTHYLKNVVKYTTNDTLLCFDNQTGEYICQITDLAKKKTTIQVTEKVKNLYICPDIWLLFAPLKKDKTDFVIEKATELGCRKIIPTITKYTITSNVKTSRYIAQSIEAAEQCRRTDIPEITEAMNIKELLQNWDVQRTLFFMDETLESKNFLQTLKENPTEKSAILVGPEGGFSEDELTLLRSLPFCKGATLGPRILRAETAATSALSCWQLISGDWSK
jgi:16S rRNA (uracil1498-N3)-methyltransferase